MKIELSKEELEWLIRICDRAMKLMDMGFENASSVMGNRKKIEVLMMRLKHSEKWKNNGGFS